MNTEPQKVLIADDDAINRDVLCELLQPEYTVLLAKNGAQALERAARHVPALVLLDVMLPYVDGFEIVGLIRSQPAWRDVPVLMLTAKNTERDTVRALDAGASDFVIKPFQPQELLARVRRFLRTGA